MCFMDEMECGCFPEPRGLCPSGEGKSTHIPSSLIKHKFYRLIIELDNPLYPTGGNKRVLSNSVWETRDSSAVLRLRKCLFLHSNFLSRILRKESFFFTENLVNWGKSWNQLEATREEVGCGSKGARTAFEMAGVFLHQMQNS